MTTLATPSKVGRSNIVSISACSDDRAQAARAGLALEGLARDRRQRRRAHLPARRRPCRTAFWYCLTSAFFGSVTDLHHRVPGQLAQRGDHRQAADQLGDQAEPDQILGLDLAEHPVMLRSCLL